jgi:hypothetical protein
MIFESLRRREQDGVIPMLFQHPRNSPQHRGVIIHDKHELSIIQEKHPDVSATQHRWQQPHQSTVPA